MLKFIDEFLLLLKTGSEKIIKFFDDIWKKIAEWFLKNKEKFLSAYDNAVLEGWKVLAKYFKTEKIIKATNGAEILCISFNKALVPVDKILMYARGKVRGVEDLAKLEKELSELKNLRQTTRKIFDKKPANTERLMELNDVLIKNAKKPFQEKSVLKKWGFLIMK